MKKVFPKQKRYRGLRTLRAYDNGRVNGRIQDVGEDLFRDEERDTLTAIFEEFEAGSLIRLLLNSLPNEEHTVHMTRY